MLTSNSWGIIFTAIGSMILVIPYIHGFKLNKLFAHVGAILMITGFILLLVASLN